MVDLNALYKYSNFGAVQMAQSMTGMISIGASWMDEHIVANNTTK